MNRLWAILLIISLSTPSTGQKFPMLHYTFEDGLPSNTVYQLYRDSKGFIWIGTDKGVARFNGMKFEVFTIFDGLPDNEIYFFKEDNYGRLWLATSNGKLCYYKNDTFHTAANTPFLKIPINQPHISRIGVEYDSSITIDFFDVSILLNIDGEKVTIKNLNELKIPGIGESELIVFGMNKRKVSKTEYLLYGSKFNCILDTQYNYSLRPVANHYYGGVRTLFSGDQEFVLDERNIYTRDIQFICARRNSKIKEYHVYNVFFEKNDYFLCTNIGLYLNDSVCILKGDVSSIAKDDIGNYWVSTLKGGVYCFRSDFLETKHYENLYSEVITYSKSVKNHLFYTTSENNLYELINGESKEIFNYRGLIRKDFKIANDAVHFIDNNYRYYNFYNEDGIVIGNILNKNPKVIKYAIPSSRFWGVKSLLIDSPYFYLKTRANIISVDYSSDTGLVHRHMFDSFSLNRIYGFGQAPDKRVWYSTSKNIYKLKDGNVQLQPQFKDISFKAFEFMGDYMVGYTFDNKLLIVSDREHNIHIDSIESGHSAWNRLYKINDSVMLISTNDLDRLLEIHSRENSFTYSLSIVEDPFVPLNIEAFCADDSNCYFFKNGSVTLMPISSLRRTNKVPVVYFSQLKSAGRSYNIAGDIELSYYKSRNISIAFIVHSFGGKRISCQYSISKTDQDNWHRVAGEEINMVNTGYGDYVVKVRAKTMGSHYSKPIVFRLHILRPYWATWWFIGLCVLCVMILIAIGFRLRVLYLIRKNKREHEQKMKFVKSEYKALNALMNPHFIFNTLNNVQSLFNANDRLAANEYLRIFADLIRQNMHNVSKELITLQRELALVMNYLMLEKLRFEDKLNYVIEIDENIDVSEFMIPPLLIQPLVENAIKHGILPMKERGGTVVISVTEVDKRLCIEVKDDGVGIGHGQEGSGIMHESFSIDNIKKRIEQLSIIQGKQFTFTMSEVNDDAGNHLWTVATIHMPIS